MTVKIKILFLFVLLLSISNVFAQGPYIEKEFEPVEEGCAPIPFGFDFMGLLNIKCYEKDRSKQCNCLEQAAKDNFLLNAMAVAKEQSLPQLRDQNRAKLTTQFMSVYSQMTVEAAAQAQILKIDETKDTEKVVGCTAKDMAEKITHKSQEQAKEQKADLEDFLAERKRLRANGKCDNTNIWGKERIKCEDLDKQIANIESHIKLTAEVEDPCPKAMAVLKTPVYMNMISKYGAGAKTELKVLIDRLVTELKKEKISNEHLTMLMRDYASYRLNTTNVTSNFKWNGQLSEAALPAPKNACQQLLTATNYLLSKARDGRVVSKEAGSRRTVNAKCVDISSVESRQLCEIMDNLNAGLTQEIKDKYSHDPKTECVSMAEYKTFKSMPDQHLMAEFLDDKNAHHLLRPPKSHEKLAESRANFLRSNPILGKLSSDSKNRRALGRALHDMAVSMKGKTSEADRLKTYLDFMQGPVKNLLNDVSKKKGTEAFICRTMIDNYTAIQVAQDIPDIDEENKEQDAFSKLMSAVGSCKRDKWNKSTTTNLSVTLDASPIFMLGSRDPVGDEKKLKEDFEQYKKNNCPDYAQKIASCPDSTPGGVEGCRQNYLNGKSSMAFSNSTQMGSISSTLTAKDMTHIERQFDPERQDKEYQEHWDKTVGSKMGSPIAKRGKEQEYIRQQEHVNTTVANTEVPQQYWHSPMPSSYPDLAESSSGATSTTSRSPASVDDSEVNEGQEVPSFVQQPAPGIQPNLMPSPVPFTPEAISQASSIQQLNPQFEQSKPEQKVKYLDELEKNLSSMPEEDRDLVEEKLRLKDERNEAEAELALLKKKNQELSEIEKQTKIVNKPIPMKQNVALPQNVAGMYPILSGSGVSTASKATIGPKNSPQSAINDALVKIHEQKGEGNTRQIASNPQGIQVEIKSTEADVKSLKGPFIVVDSLKAKSHEEYDELKKDANKLAEFVAKGLSNEKIKGLKNNDIIAITDPSTDKKILFKVSKTSNTSFSLESWPTNVVAQQHFLKDIRNLLKK